ncbi:hydrolase [Salmonella sp. NCTC 11881]|nr:hydrolase [Salmonella sp. NCTC 11881]
MKAERILGALYGQALGDAMGMPSELWPRTRVKAHFGWIDRFLPGPKRKIMPPAILTARSLRMIPQWRSAWPTRYSNAKATLIPRLLGVTSSPGRNALMRSIKMYSARRQKIALNAIRDGKPIAALENNGVTNGAAMRVSPLGCLLPPTNLTAFIAEVALASSPTHKSDSGGGWRRGCRLGRLTSG